MENRVWLQFALRNSEDFDFNFNESHRGLNPQKEMGNEKGENVERRGNGLCVGQRLVGGQCNGGGAL